MQRNDLDNRLRELGIYSDFYYRKELKALMQMLGEYERLNCLLTGVHEGNRKMVAVTDRRIIVLFTALGGGDVKIIWPRVKLAMKLFLSFSSGMELRGIRTSAIHFFPGTTPGLYSRPLFHFMSFCFNTQRMSETQPLLPSMI